MAVTFCGHGDIQYDEEVKSNLYRTLERLILSNESEFLLGGYGNFDFLAAETLKQLKSSYPYIKVLLVVPYINRGYSSVLYDGSVYPPIEKVPKRLAILKRNEWMIDMSSAVIAYVLHNWGGAAKTLKYAYRKNKDVINLVDCLL